MKKCFVIMPFSSTPNHKYHTEDYWTRHYDNFLKPLIEKSGKYTVTRSEPLRGNIAGQIIANLISADVVVADITDFNPNVLWELGVRQCRKHGTITIAEKETPIPFHFKQKGIFFYNIDHIKDDTFNKQLEKALDDCYNKPSNTDSPVLEAVGGQGSLIDIIHREENDRKIKAIIDEMDYNVNVYDGIIEYLNKPSESIKKQGVSKYLFNIQHKIFNNKCIDNLIVTRYIQADYIFYARCIVYSNTIQEINTLIPLLATKPKFVVDYFIDHHEKFQLSHTELLEIMKNYKVN